MKKQLTLGKTGVNVTSIGLGAMPLSLNGRPNEEQAIQVIDEFINGGGTFIDTANVYCKDDAEVGHNERLIHKALAQLGKLDDIIVSTKGGLTRPRGNWEVDASPGWLRQSCEKSLKDLNTDCIFLYQLHAPDPNVPLNESVGELVRLNEAGKIRHIGLSNVNVNEIGIALEVTPIMSVQNRCNIFEQKSFKNGVVEKCKNEGITFIAHSPVGGHYGHIQTTKNRQLNKFAAYYRVSPYQIMLAWLLRKENHILPIPGASKVTSTVDSLKALDVILKDADFEKLNRI